MSRQSSWWISGALLVVGLLCIATSAGPTSLFAITGYLVLFAAAVSAFVSLRMPARPAAPTALSEDERRRWHTLADEKGTTVAVRELRRAHPYIGIAEAKRLVDSV